MGYLPNTGMNASLPIYFIVGLVMIIVGGITSIRAKFSK